eukprot:TRINITY_DN37567_c0_g1_i1.p2 TRINITY_DN37567_c0_g1~~TRINITY_DN37567_c0_g1_i1.p2  ORF type:complete len:124 (+),score=22.69 TRINITY_DN37567_c0_g1_i1:12-383(+)
MTSAQPRTNLQAAIAKLNGLVQTSSKLVTTRQQLESQLSENELVISELKLLAEESTVYKLVGPVLVEQEKVEARDNVKKRIEYIKAEIERTEKLITDANEKQEACRKEVMELKSKTEAMASKS